MPITIRANQAKYKSEATGEYVGFNVIGEVTTDELVAEINEAGATQLDAVNGAGETQVDNVEAAGAEQVSAVNDTGATQVGAVNTAGETQVGVVNATGATQVGNVNTAGTTQVGLVNAEGATQVQAVEDKGAEVLESIPDDYEEKMDQVNDYLENLVVVSDTQPESESNKLWIEDQAEEEIEVPTYEEFESLFGELGNIPAIKTALLQIAQKVAYIDDDGEKYYRDLHNAFYSPIAISVAFSQGNRTVFSNAELDSLKEFITVTATYFGGHESVLNPSEYDLTGELTAGTSTVTAKAGNATDTFDVVVTEFYLPSDFTRYDYIQKKTTSQSRVATSSFIILNAQQDMNVLNLEAYVALKGNTNGNAGFFGARNGDYNQSYSLYCNDGAGLYGVAFGKEFTTNYQIPASSVRVTKVEYIRDSETTAFVRINDSIVKQLSVNNPVVIPHGFCLFNNFPYDSTSNFDIQEQARLGDIILRTMDGECVGYYVPGVYDGKICLYDVVSESFYTAANATVVTISNSGCLYAVGNW